MAASATSSGAVGEPTRTIQVAPRRLAAVAVAFIGLGFVAGWLAHPATNSRPDAAILAAYKALNEETSRLLARQQARLADDALRQAAPATPTAGRP